MNLGLFTTGTGYHMGAWRRPDSRAEDLMSLSLMSEVATLCEGAKLDAIFIADGVSQDPRHARNPSHQPLEPLTLLSALAARTASIGLIASFTTTFSEPYNCARLFSSLDHLSGGRAGWNIVTSSVGGDNFGYAEHPPHRWRYERATEFLEAVTALWSSWDADAVVVDREHGIYARPERVHRVDFSGEHFKVAGPLNLPRSPQGRPVYAQAGSSADGIAFAARFAEAVFTAQATLEDALTFAKTLRAEIARAGRDPAAVRIMPGLVPIVAPTETEARQLADELATWIDFEHGRRALEAQLGEIDLSDLPLDQPIPPERLPATVEQNQSRYEMFRRLAVDARATLRDLIVVKSRSHGHRVVVGAPEQVADEMQQWFQAEACDGYILQAPFMMAGLEAITEMLVPVLQERGLFRTEYEGTTLRSHLGLDPLGEDLRP